MQRPMQTTAECGEDFTGCVTLAAAENVKNNKSGSNYNLAEAVENCLEDIIKYNKITKSLNILPFLLINK